MNQFDKQLAFGEITNVMKLISTPDKWTKGCYARDENGTSASMLGTEAKCFCTLGALFRVTCTHESKGARAIRDELGGDWDSTQKWNDDPARTHQEVLAMLNYVRVRLT